MDQRLVGRNERGLRVGEDHQRAVLTNAQVEMLRTMHEEGLSYGALARMFEVSKSLVARICRYELRAQPPQSWRPARGGRALTS